MSTVNPNSLVRKRFGRTAIAPHPPHQLVYGTHGKSNFVKTMLRLGAEREEIRVVADQIGSPTWTGDIASAIAGLIPQPKVQTRAVLPLSNSGVASWYDSAVAIFEEARHLGLKVQRVIPTTSDYPTAQRPTYSVLLCENICDSRKSSPLATGTQANVGRTCRYI